MRNYILILAILLGFEAIASPIDSIEHQRRERRETVSILLLAGAIFTTAGFYASQPKTALPLIAPGAAIAVSIGLRIPIGKKNNRCTSTNR